MPEQHGKTYDRGDFGPPQIVKPEESSSSISIPDVFQLGIQFEYLRNLVDSEQEEPPIKLHVIRILEDIDSSLSNQDARGTVSELVTKQQRQIGDTNDSEERISEDQAETLKKQVTSWIHLFARDLADETRIPAAGSGVLDIDILTERPNEIFSPDVWDWLDARPKEDIEEACRSVAVGCATASVMLSLRAVEHCLRKWYEQENESLDAAWGRVLDQLMEEYAQEDKRNDTVLTQLSDLPPVLTTLYYLKEKRNEVNHPQESPSLREARRTLLIVSSTITEIYEVMRDQAAEEALEEVDRGPTLAEWGDSSPSGHEKSEEEEEILELIFDMCDQENNAGVERSQLIDAASDLGYEKPETEHIIQSLLMSGNVYEPAGDVLKPI